MFKNITKEEKQVFAKLLRDTASDDPAVREPAMDMFIQALELPLRQGIMSGDILGNIFEMVEATDGRTTMEFMLDPIAPGTENEFVAFTYPQHGYVPERHVEGDYVQVPIYGITNAIDWDIEYARDARFDLFARLFDVMQSGFTKKMNDDGWQTLLSAAFDRNIIVSDTDAAVGQFTKRLVSLMKVVMTRNGGGNTTSLNRGKLTDLYVSTEAMEDIRNWNVDQIDEITRNQIFNSEEGVLNRIFGVNLHELTELGEGQEYQLYFDNELSGTMPGSDVEIVVGLDRQRSDSFVMPMRDQIEIHEDPVMHRQKKNGLYGWSRYGVSVLNSARVLFGSL